MCVSARVIVLYVCFTFAFVIIIIIIINLVVVGHEFVHLVGLDLEYVRLSARLEELALKSVELLVRVLATGGAEERVGTLVALFLAAAGLRLQLIVDGGERHVVADGRQSVVGLLGLHVLAFGLLELVDDRLQLLFVLREHGRLGQYRLGQRLDLDAQVLLLLGQLAVLVQRFDEQIGRRLVVQVLVQLLLVAAVEYGRQLTAYVIHSINLFDQNVA